MKNDAQKAGVIRHYDTHPINEDEILAKLAARGVHLDALTEDTLKDLDQDHYGGVHAVDVLCERAGVRREHHVLDVCSGMGGPARWIAHRVGCHVTGLDFTLSRVESARRLTLRVGLDRLVDFVHGDATSMPFPNAVFDVAISQEAWLHIPDKSAVIGQCVRVLKADGVLAFTDVMRRGSLTMAEESRLTTEMQAPQVASTERYLELLRSRGCTVSGFDDLSAEWTRILADRLEMYRALRDTTVAKFGEAHFAAWDRAYSFFVGLFAEGKLGGTRIVARTPAR